MNANVDTTNTGNVSGKSVLIAKTSDSSIGEIGVDQKTTFTTIELEHNKTVVVTWNTEKPALTFWINVGKQYGKSKLVMLQKLLG